MVTGVAIGSPPPEQLRHHPRYEVGPAIGTGGMGVVYEAWHRLMDRRVAIKVVREDAFGLPGMDVRFEREIRAAARLSHPNIVTAYDAERYGSIHFLAMEYVPGVNLGDLVTDRPLGIAEACDYARQVALGLQHAHERGTVHRDVKPHNLILSRSESGAGGVIKILDFGLARFVQEALPGSDTATWIPLSGSGTLSGAVVGTRDYVAPEQASDPRGADIRADVYSLGCTLYHFLAGRPPFADVPVEAKPEAHRRTPVVPITAWRPDVPPGLAQVLDRMLAKDPNDRYQSPGEVADALAPYAGTIARSPQPIHKPTVLRHRRFVVLLTAAICTGLLGLTGLALHLRSRAATGDQRGTPDGEPRLVTDVRVLSGHVGPVRAVAYSGNGQRLVSGSYDGTLRVWDPATGAELGTLRGHTNRVHAVAVSKDGRLVVSGSHDQTARVWDLETGRELAQFNGAGAEVKSVALIGDGRHALAGTAYLTCLWDLRTGKEIRRYRFHGEALACSPDGRAVVSGGLDNDAHLWDVGTGDELRVFHGHVMEVRAVAFRPGHRQILTGSEDEGVTLWELGTGAAVANWNLSSGYVWGLAVTPDGARVLATGWDGTAGLIDVETGRQLQKLAPERNPASKQLNLISAAISPDGRQAAVGGSDGKIYLWPLPSP